MCSEKEDSVKFLRGKKMRPYYAKLEADNLSFYEKKSAKKSKFRIALVELDRISRSDPCTGGAKDLVCIEFRLSGRTEVEIISFKDVTQRKEWMESIFKKMLKIHKIPETKELNYSVMEESMTSLKDKMKSNEEIQPTEGNLYTPMPTATTEEHEYDYAYFDGKTRSESLEVAKRSQENRYTDHDKGNIYINVKSKHCQISLGDKNTQIMTGVNLSTSSSSDSDQDENEIEDLYENASSLESKTRQRVDTANDERNLYENTCLHVTKSQKSTPASADRLSRCSGHYWYDGKADIESIKRCFDGKPPYTFLVRVSSDRTGCLSLQLKLDSDPMPKNYKISSQSDRYWLVDKETFGSLNELLTHYKTHPLPGHKKCLRHGYNSPEAN